jgi:hypothetical protein
MLFFLFPWQFPAHSQPEAGASENARFKDLVQSLQASDEDVAPTD